MCVLLCGGKWCSSTSSWCFLDVQQRITEWRATIWSMKTSKYLFILLEINIEFGYRIFEIKYFEEFYFSCNYPSSLGCLRELSLSCSLKSNYYFTFYWIKFQYEIWDYYNKALFYSIFPTSRHSFVCGSYSSIELQKIILEEDIWNLS